MASASTATQQNSKKSTSSSSKSHFKKTVCLQDWWLEKPENNSKGSPLAIAGITLRAKQAVRLFSAPILKRWDVTTLETVDGVFVIIRGFMNKARTEANGFSSEIGKHFVYGFPSDWEIYAKKFYVGEFPLSSVSKRSQDFEPLSPLPSIGDSIIKSPQRENCPGRTCAPKNLDKHFQDSLLSPCHMTTKGVLPEKSVPAVEEEVNKIESCKKSLTENFLGSPAVLEVENHGEMHRELTDSVSNVIMSEDEEIMPKSGSVEEDHAIAEAIPAYKLRDQPVLKRTVNDTKTITPPVRRTRRGLSSTKQKQKQKQKVGGVKQCISQSATPRSRKPENKSAYGSSTSRKRKDKSSAVSSPLSSSVKRSRSGRLLLPILEFWRNQVAVYDKDRQVTAVKGLNLDHS